MKSVFEIDANTLDYNLSYSSNKYRLFFGNLHNKFEEDKDKLSQILNCSRNYCQTYYSAKNLLDNYFINKNNSNQLLSHYVASKSVVNSLEEVINQERTYLSNFDTSFNFSNIWNENSSEYDNVKNVLLKASEVIENSNGESLLMLKDYFDMHSNYMGYFLANFDSNYFSQNKDKKWNIGPIIINGVAVKRIVHETKKQKPEISKNKEKEINQQFNTPMEKILYEEKDVLSKNEIIGDIKLIEDLEYNIQMLFCYNEKRKFNPYQATKMFKGGQILQGAAGTGKTAVAKYLIWYANKLNEHFNSNLIATSFNIDSSMYDGNIQKLKSQLKKIEEGNAKYFIFQDEINQLIKSNEMIERDPGKSDINLEIQKFMEGNYINNGNYIIFGTTNLTTKLSPAIRRRFEICTWKGAESIEDKARLFKSKLYEGIQNGYVNISDNEFMQIAMIANEFNFTGSDITVTCANAMNKSYDKKSILENCEMAKNDEDPKKQLELIYGNYKEINKSIIEESIFEKKAGDDEAIESSIVYENS